MGVPSSVWGLAGHKIVHSLIGEYSGLYIKETQIDMLPFFSASLQRSLVVSM